MPKKISFRSGITIIFIANVVLYLMLWYYWTQKFALDLTPLNFASACLGINVVLSYFVKSVQPKIPFLLLSASLFYGLIIVYLLFGLANV